MKPFFVTATGTAIGKTYVTAGIIRAARLMGNEATGIKPLLSGYNPAAPEASDSGALLAAMGKPITEETIAAITPWRFAAPLSPDMAAAREGRSISLRALTTFCRVAAQAAPGLMLIEGVGGVMVPIETVYTVREWISALEIPAILVAGTYLGTISHTLTAIEALHARQIEIAAIVLSESEHSPIPNAELASAIAKFAPRIQIHTIARDHNEPAFKQLAWALGQYQLAEL
ncbi:MAG: dethiobiotin synthase [Acidocella sp. 20-57-95]|nr:MAG: dethiobiotin synthase [Acidocella sp. 20-57-95]OYV62488.1 MAG: dethiobiotin synthase [Acidocella sp. 21-58-7]HQT64071.1 dethiobiotin synthase [Acidocella sp.]HQU03351.1 dethiobiotin synthase [Acidocella sp.]